ncbi:hypothetical protein F5Y17DRAFT_448036 [Xylariaceae sp. FL0594]|nr:hypothetical protein F5Y17DRAFT_448036 [Xylariaceae sp. FL0594]
MRKKKHNLVRLVWFWLFCVIVTYSLNPDIYALTPLPPLPLFSRSPVFNSDSNVRDRLPYIAGVLFSHYRLSSRGAWEIPWKKILDRVSM